MLQLFQYAFGIQPHYVVAHSFGDAERTIMDAGEAVPKRIENLGPYVLITPEED
jgi:hypothetical protein